MTRRKRKIILVLGIAVLTGVILLVAFPIWFPWLAKPISGKLGVHYQRYERVGFSQFKLHDVSFTQSNLTFQAAQVEGNLPTALAWRNFREDPRERLHVADWTLEILESDSEQGTNSVQASVQKVNDTIALLKTWLPRIRLERGTVQLSGQVIAVPIAEFEHGALKTEISVPERLPKTELVADFGLAGTNTISVRIPRWELSTTIALHDAPQQLRLNGHVLWRSNRAEIQARFNPEDLWPDSASIQAHGFSVPAEMLKMQGYDDLVGTFDLQWSSNQFSLAAMCDAQPLQSERETLSAFHAVVEARGDTNLVRVEKAAVNSSWLEANLSENVVFDFHGKMLSPTARLNLAIDLSRQKWFGVTGLLQGYATLTSGENRFPETSFQLRGADISTESLQSEEIVFRGTLDWPRLNIASAEVEFGGGGKLQGSLEYDAVAREIFNGQLKGEGPIGRQLLPPEISLANVHLDAQFRGPLEKITHSGRTKIQSLKLPRTALLQIEADWLGQHLDLQNINGTITCKESSVRIRGATQLDVDSQHLQVDRLSFSTNQQIILELQNPFSVSVQKKGAHAIQVKSEPIQLTGGNREISLAGMVLWPNQGNVTAKIREVDFSVAADFFAEELPEIHLRRFNFSGAWTNAPLHFSVDALAQFFSEDGTPFAAELQAKGDPTGVAIERAEAGTESEAVISGKGFLPIAFTPADSSNLVQVLPKEVIDFRASTVANEPFWDRISRWTKTTVVEPSATIAVSGTLDAPEGRILMSAKEMIWKPAKPDQPVPRFQNLLADIDLERSRIRLNRFEVFVEGQPVTASGELPLPDTFSSDLSAVFDWRKANANLKIVDAEIARFSRLAPAILSPLGTFNADVAIRPGGRLLGELRVANAALRPIASLGPIQDIEGRLNFLDDEVQLETFKGTIGGQAVDLSGKVDLRQRDSTNGLPRFNLQLRGTNVPLARQPEIILRSDMNLNISNAKGGAPVISGRLDLRQSFFLADLKILIPGQVARPKQRPPYFSIEQESLALWRLDLAVNGNEFLRVQSPIFQGDISARFKLSGTLKEPTLLGDATIVRGVVQFPFANLRVEQGFVSLTSEDPYRPKLSVNSSARTFGYDIQMDLSGFADQPEVEFSSNPGLTSEQILLMITAGELPRDEINFSTQQKAGRLAFFLGKNVISKFRGGYATEERLIFRSGEEVSEQGQQTYYIEYKLSDDWSIVGEYDRFGGVNAGFKWRFFSK